MPWTKHFNSTAASFIVHITTVYSCLSDGSLRFLASICSLFPLTFYCINSDCKYIICNTLRKLQTAVEHEAILYTSNLGPIPVRVHQFTCNGKPGCLYTRTHISNNLKGCGVVYHPDYYVQAIAGTTERQRIYYHHINNLPDVLQVSTHHFVETSLVQMWRSNFLHAWWVWFFW